MSLWSLFLRHRGRIADKWAHYFPIYERHFARYVNTPFVFIEIGCGKGGSLQLWKEYFGPLVTIVGIDIREKCRQFEEDQIHVQDRRSIESGVPRFCDRGIRNPGHRAR